MYCLLAECKGWSIEPEAVFWSHPKTKSGLTVFWGRGQARVQGPGGIIWFSLWILDLFSLEVFYFLKFNFEFKIIARSEREVTEYYEKREDYSITVSKLLLAACHQHRQRHQVIDFCEWCARNQLSFHKSSWSEKFRYESTDSSWNANWAYPTLSHEAISDKTPSINGSFCLDHHGDSPFCGRKTLRGKRVSPNNRWWQCSS